jgi:hypothetical protein
MREPAVLPDGQITANFLSIPLGKNIPLHTERKSATYARRPVPLRGVRTSRTLVRDAMDADVSMTNGTEADGEVVWS